MSNILIAEDDVFLARMYQLKLKKLGFASVQHLPSGDKVYQAIKKNPPDLLILDMIMPQKTGFEVLKEVRSDHSLKKLPILVLTNLSQPEDIAEIKKLGATVYLGKSKHSFNEVAQEVQRLLKAA